MYTKILMPLDGSQQAEKALPYLQWFIKVSHVNEVVFLQAVEPFSVPGSVAGVIMPDEKKHIEQDAVKLARTYLEKIAGSFKNKKFKVVTEVLVGKPAKVIADYVKICDVDLIIMAAPKISGMRRLVRGTVTDEILHTAHVPVFMVKWQDKAPDK